MSELLSVIVPVYNTEQYLRKCIESILNQTYEKIELILVDDGSTDMSGMICDEYKEADRRVKVIHKKQQGPLKARQAGVLKARANYVTFVDSDDWIKDQTYELLMDTDEKSDIIVSGIITYYDEDTMIIEKPIIRSGIYLKTAIEQHIIPYMLWSRKKNHWELNPSLCTKIFKKQLIEKYLTKAAELDIHYGEDIAVIYPMMLEAQSICVMHECCYFHRQRDIKKGLPYIKNDSDYFRKLYYLYEYLKTAFKNSIYCDTLLNQLDHFYMMSVNLKQQYYSAYSEANRDVFPFWRVGCNTKIILYGAGELGKEYFRQNECYRFCRIIMWADKNFVDMRRQGKNISDPELIDHTEFDYLLIAIKNIELAQEVRDNFIKNGISAEKIIWSEVNEKFFNL